MTYNGAIMELVLIHEHGLMPEQLKRRLQEVIEVLSEYDPSAEPDVPDINVGDMISRQAAIDLCDWYDNPSMREDLEKLPSVQPEIIKCKDCKYFGLSTDKLTSRYKIAGCFRLEKLAIEYPSLTDGNGFCSWAERRQDG